MRLSFVPASVFADDVSNCDVSIEMYIYYLPEVVFKNYENYERICAHPNC